MLIPKNNKPLRLALVGTSGFAPRHVMAFRQTGDADVAVVHSRSQERASTFASLYDIASTSTNIDNLCEDPGIDAAIIVCEPSRHAEIALRFLRAGKPILVEKPFDLDLKRAEEVVALANNSDIVASVVSQKRFDPALRKMKQELSQVRRPICARLSMMWNRGSDYFDAGNGWRAKGSAVFLNQGIHWLDIMNWFFGKPVFASVVARRTRDFIACPDECSALVAYESGVPASLHASINMANSLKDDFSIVHENGVLNYQDFDTSKTDRHCFLFDWHGKARSSPLDLMALQAHDFIKAVRTGCRPETNLDDALEALKLALLLSPKMDDRTQEIWCGTVSC